MALKNLIPWKKKDESLAVRRPENPVEALRSEMDRLFEGALSLWPNAFDFADRRLTGGFLPEVDLTETDQEVKVTAELPGLDEKDLELNIEEGGLTIRGEKRQEREEERKGTYFSERSYGAFHRYIPLPEDLLRDKAEAKFRKGVLEVSIPKAPEAASKRKALTIKVE